MIHDDLINPIAICAADLIEQIKKVCDREEISDISGISKDFAGFPSLGLRRSAHLPVLAAIASKISIPILLLTDRTDRALTLADELAFFTENRKLSFFPEPNPLFYEKSPWGVTTRRDRLMVLSSLVSYQIPGLIPPSTPPIIIAPVRAAMTRTIPRREFIKQVRVIKPTQTISLEELARTLFIVGYEPVTTVVAQGQFARRGGLLDLWPPGEPDPSRLDFFGNEVEFIRRFDPQTQRSISKIQQVVLTPSREYILPAESLIQSDEIFEKYNEFQIPILHTTRASLMDYLPRQALIVIDNLEELHNTVQEIEEQAIQLRADYVKEGTLAEGYALPYLTWLEIVESLSIHVTLELGPSSALEPSNLSQAFTAEQRFGGRLKPLLEYANERCLASERLVIVSRQASRLDELWNEQPYSRNANLTPPAFIEGSLTEGWSFKPPSCPGLHLLTDGEIFGWRRPELRKRYHASVEAPEAAYGDLQVGDWVVHVDHGVGRFLGIVNRTIDHLERDYVAIEYAQGDQLFVPVHQVDRLTRYVGPDGRDPSPSRLGGVEWRNVKSRVKEAVIEVAEDLLALYAQRQIVNGNAFSNDNPWQQELEASFPYVETEDQLRVISEVKQDMQTPRPMDRLICGDVGYGKTEVALRAAFKAVMDNKQVALLVPTTILAQQHYNTFRERLAAFPVEVEMLSRFRTPQQQKDILQRLEMGAIDIIIGTHRLIQEDVKFKDLGLLIIDEEQRFGVSHKEYLKKKRTEVDVLTMTATPIPRTLYMALTGVRDVSTINTPPEERLPIVTHVGPYSPRIVRQAILRELERGGQVFFVHNRVQTITAIRSHLEKLIPEARLAVAHGQMDEEQLANRMEQFASGEIDVLISTSIIESGLDIPNANTLIVDRADTFGLSQLYQLRGRVGRGAQRAYAYFFKHRHRVPTLEGRQRLETIAENTQLGAGYSIAMRDLEIRGAGDILGNRQHGHIAAVGFHLYTRLLTEAVTHLRSERGMPADKLMAGATLQRPLISIDLPFTVGIPSGYVTDKTMRLKLYRRIADLQTIGDLEAIMDEFTDRFGIPPEPVTNLLFQLKVRLLAELVDVISVSAENGQIAIRFRSGSPPENMRDSNHLFRIGKTAVWMPYLGNPNWKESLIGTLELLSNYKASD